jgi:hypothetical protein
LRQALLQGRDDVDHVAAGRLRRRRFALLTLGLGVDQLFNVFAVSVDIWRINSTVMPSISFMARLTSFGPAFR